MTGMEVRDVLTGVTFTIARARHHQRGRRAGAGDHGACSAIPRDVPMLKAMNLVTTLPASDMALAAPAAVGPDADAGAVARPRADRHQPVVSVPSAVGGVGHGGRGRGVRRRRQQRVSRH